MIYRICMICGVGLGVKEGEGPDGKDAVSHGLCGHCEAFEQARDDAEVMHDMRAIATVSGFMWSAYRWRATANVLKAAGWTFPKGTFIE